MEKMDENKALKVLDACYEKALEGVPLVSQSVEELAEEYIQKYGRTEKAIEKLITNQITKCGTSGFLGGLGGIVVLPIAVPVNITSVLYVQMRMIACIAYINGHEPESDDVKTLVYLCLLGKAMADIAKQYGIQIANKVAMASLKKLPGRLLIEINKKVGFRLLTKMGTKGAVNLVKLVPVAGGIVGATIDISATKAIAYNAKKHFSDINC